MTPCITLGLPHHKWQVDISFWSTICMSGLWWICDYYQVFVLILIFFLCFLIWPIANENRHIWESISPSIFPATIPFFKRKHLFSTRFLNPTTCSRNDNHWECCPTPSTTDVKALCQTLDRGSIQRPRFGGNSLCPKNLSWDVKQGGQTHYFCVFLCFFKLRQRLWFWPSDIFFDLLEFFFCFAFRLQFCFAADGEKENFFLDLYTIHVDQILGRCRFWKYATCCQELKIANIGQHFHTACAFVVFICVCSCRQLYQGRRTVRICWGIEDEHHLAACGARW